MKLLQQLALQVPSTIEAVRADASRYPGRWYVEMGFWATASYRLGRLARSLNGPIRLLLLTPHKLLNQFFHIVYKVDISPHAEIGPGLVLVHPRNIIIGSCRIGKNCLIFHEVTLGMNANSQVFPELGDDVDIYAGARVIGEIRLGNDVKVGANCVVSQSVPDGCTVVVAKNRIIPKSLVDAFGPRRVAQGTGTPPPERRVSPAEEVASPAASDPWLLDQPGGGKLK